MDLGWSKFFSILELTFVEGMLLAMWEHLDTRKEHQVTQESWEVSLYRCFLFLLVCI